MNSTQTWETIASHKLSLRAQALKPYVVSDVDQRVPQVRNVHDRSRLDYDTTIQAITDISSIPVLLDLLCQGKFTAEEVTSAYIKRAVLAHQITNSITEALFKDALAQARDLDHTFRKTGKLQGPLHGIPITLKDQFNIRGVDTTLGYVGRSFKPATDDAVLVQMLKGMGAVIIAKTNLPQSIMWAETENPLWGLTTNPRNPRFTPGGSTGGEGALLALRGSILGFGTDIGGSIRIPQAVMGLYGFKPSSHRFPYHGVPVSTEGQEHVPSSIGPMARDLESICYITRLIADNRPWDFDPKCLPLPWNENSFQEIQSRPMVIGIILDDGVVKPHPPIERVLLKASKLLQEQGHEVILWNASDHQRYIQLMDLYYTADGCEDIIRDVTAAGEPFIPHVKSLIARGSAISVYEYWQLNKQKFDLQKRYLDKWNAVRSPSGRPVDVLLSPTLPHTAVPHRAIKWIGYTKIWNILDYPAITFPLDEVRVNDDQLPAVPYCPRNEADSWNWGQYDLENMDGHPVNLQVIGKRFEEEKVLGAAAVIEKIWRGGH